jgi:hypothetical protein
LNSFAILVFGENLRTVIAVDPAKLRANVPEMAELNLAKNEETS